MGYLFHNWRRLFPVKLRTNLNASCSLFYKSELPPLPGNWIGKWTIWRCVLKGLKLITLSEHLSSPFLFGRIVHSFKYTVCVLFLLVQVLKIAVPVGLYPFVRNFSFLFLLLSDVKYIRFDVKTYVNPHHFKDYTFIKLWNSQPRNHGLSFLPAK